MTAVLQSVKQYLIIAWSPMSKDAKLIPCSSLAPYKPLLEDTYLSLLIFFLMGSCSDLVIVLQLYNCISVDPCKH